MKMLNDFVKEAIEDVNSVEEFDILLKKWQLSDAPQEFKEAAIRELKAKKSIFYISPNSTPDSVYADMQAGAADIDDIN